MLGIRDPTEYALQAPTFGNATADSREDAITEDALLTNNVLCDPALWDLTLQGDAAKFGKTRTVRRHMRGYCRSLYWPRFVVFKGHYVLLLVIVCCRAWRRM